MDNTKSGLRGVSTRTSGTLGHFGHESGGQDSNSNSNAAENMNVNESFSRFMMQGQRENTELSRRFFHKDNIDQLQRGIIDGVYRKSNGRFRVSPQNETNMKIVMQHIYFEEAHYMDTDVSSQVRDLNAKVLHYCIDNVYNNYISYAKYRRDSETIHLPMDRPQYSRADQNKTLEFKGWF